MHDRSVRILKNAARSLLEQIRMSFQSAGARVNEKPLIVLGNQKSGTTAIAALLAEHTGLSVSLDLKKEIRRPTIHRVKSGEISFADFVHQHKLDFSREIIKEPSLSLFYDELVEYFPQSKFVMVIRDPRDNIRSILNRLDIPGDLQTLDDEHQKNITPAWQLILDGKWLELDGNNYIEMLAQRWNLTTDVYLNNREQLLLCRYETFLEDKAGEIGRLAQTLELPGLHDIRSKVDIQFQPAGKRGVNWLEFFGADNLKRIERICSDRMRQFDYGTG